MAVYHFPILVDLSKSIAQVGELTERLNSELSAFGVPERMAVTGEIGAMTLSLDRGATNEELESVRKLLDSEFTTRFPEFALSVGQPRCQTGKSSSQSTSAQ